MPITFSRDVSGNQTSFSLRLTQWQLSTGDHTLQSFCQRSRIYLCELCTSCKRNVRNVRLASSSWNTCTPPCARLYKRRTSSLASPRNIVRAIVSNHNENHPAPLITFCCSRCESAKRHVSAARRLCNRSLRRSPMSTLPEH